MIYIWRDCSTGKEVEINRPVEEIAIPPTKKEAKDAGLTEEEISQAEWERLLVGGIGTINFGMKGRW